ncbi:epimerase [Algirhabdus cladophorae]|uniref:epimerase n=1 Tax=Algirhabdus cladophorae TaxID=3377108 RepID=UPI003B84B455
MENTVLILGGSGRFGRNATEAFKAAGWEVRQFDRATDNLWDAAWGASVIVNAWNPVYYDWARDLGPLNAQVIEVATASKSTVILPGNIYNFGRDMPSILGDDTPQNATTGLGRLRVDVEAAYRASSVQTIVLRAGDFLEKDASGNWFDKVIAPPLSKMKITYPGALDVIHSWAYLPDMARAAVLLAERRKSLPSFVDIPFEGYSLTARDLAAGFSEALGKTVTPKQMGWLPIWVAQPFWPLAKHLLEMRYLWDTPHQIDGSVLDQFCPEFRATPLVDALRYIAQDYVHPDQPVSPRRTTVVS